MTNTENLPTILATNMSAGIFYLYEGAWFRAAQVEKDGNGVWLYTTTGDAHWFLLYTTLYYSPAGL